MWLVLDPLNPLCGLSYTQGEGRWGRRGRGGEGGRRGEGEGEWRRGRIEGKEGWGEREEWEWWGGTRGGSLVPSPTKLTQGERIWCHKSKSLDKLQKLGAANQIAERCLSECGSENKYFNGTTQSILWDSLFNTVQFVTNNYKASRLPQAQGFSLWHQTLTWEGWVWACIVFYAL